MEPSVPSPAETVLPAQSLLYRLVASKLDSDPLEFIRARRTGQVRVPFRLIAQELAAASEVDVTYEAVRRWWRSTPEGQQELGDVEDTGAAS